MNRQSTEAKPSEADLRGPGQPHAPLDIEQSFTHLLHRVGQCATDAFQRHVGALPVTARQFAVLVAIKRMDGSSQMDVVKATGIDRSTLADMIQRMLGKGLIQRERSLEDGRANRLSLTPEGRQLLEQAAPGARQADEALVARLSAEQRVALTAALTSVLEHASAAGSATNGSHD